MRDVRSAVPGGTGAHRGVGLAQRGVGAGTHRGVDNELIVLQHTDRTGIGMDEVRSLLHDFVENRGRVELRCEEPPGSGKLLRERACCALACFTGSQNQDFALAKFTENFLSQINRNGAN